jgi:Kef-type K+ transport system membrane component KefB
MASTRTGPITRYLVLVVLPALAIVVALYHGSDLGPGPSPVHLPESPPPAGGTPLAHPGLLLAQILAILLVTRVCGLLVRRVGQPQVVGEMLAGILLGPSLFGALAPGAASSLFPPSSLGALSSVSQIGMVLFMFLVGLELDTASLRAQGQAAILTSHVSIVVPFALGAGLALALYPRFAPPGIPFSAFALFLGAAMSVTAFPVLARILAERGLLRTPLGTLAMSTAAVDDVTAWMILAAIMAMVRSGSGQTPAWVPPLGLVLFVGTVLLVRNALRRRVAAAFERRGRLGHDLLAALVGLALAGACITEAIGVHALFGSFLVGLTLASEHRIAEAARERLEDLLVVVLLPLYFAFTGLRTRLDLLVGGEVWGWAAAILAVAVAGKLAGSAVAARVSGLPWRDALALGTLMNTRGLMELVILNVGLDLGVLSPALYSMMVLMAVTTTVMTQPLLSLLGVPGGATSTRIRGPEGP